MMQDYVVIDRAVNGGVQMVYKFENGYGASVVRFPFSYGGYLGLWEMALLKFKNSEDGELLWEIVYREDFAGGDVAGHLSDKDVTELLMWIKSL